MSDAAAPEPPREAETQRAAPARLFNFETMSGVFPGTRTQVFQRVRLRDSGAVAGDAAGAAAEWAQIFWSEEPPACLVAPLEMESGRTGAPLVQLEAPLHGELGGRLRAALAEQGKRLATCGTCLHWQPAAERSADGLPLGACRLRRANERTELPLDLAVQSLLALDCPHWLEAPLQTSSAGAALADAPALPTAPLPRQAVITESKKPWLTRMALRMRRALVQAAPHAPTQPLVERSGVGAGTEPCFACQGRIANLGALTVASSEGDKQTFSVWRCRLCYTLYLSDWIDRWERVDSLETEETIYRIAPVEAAELLALIGSVQGGDHPRLRAERGAQRAWVLEQLAQRPVLSHVIKQGR